MLPGLAKHSELHRHVIVERQIVLYDEKDLTPTRSRIYNGLSWYRGGGHFLSAGYAVPLEATAENTFKIDPAPIFELDASKGQMTIKRPSWIGFSRRGNNESLKDQICQPLHRFWIGLSY